MRAAGALLLLLTASWVPPVGAQAAPGGGFELRVLAHQARVRSALDGLVPPERNVPLFGLELTAPTPWRPLRAEARLLRSARGGADLRATEAGLVLAWRAVGVSAAYAQRGSYAPASGLAHERNAAFGRLGARLATGPAAFGLEFHARADAYLPFTSEPDPANDIKGWDAASGVTWRPARLPVSATLGYRLERFRIFSVEQEVSALTFALGYAIGGR